jgi:hypothetical protein
MLERVRVGRTLLSAEQLKEVIMLFRDAVFSRQHDR